MARSVILMKAGLLSQKNEGKVTKIGTKIPVGTLSPQGWMGLPTPGMLWLMFSCILTRRGVSSPVTPVTLVVRDKKEYVKEKEA